MKKSISILIFVTVALFAMSAMAADKVVVIPLNTSGGPATKLWGEGRVGTGTTLHTTANGINIAKSNGIASWASAAAVCPKNTWVCTAAEASLIDVDSGQHDVMGCSGISGSDIRVWVQDEDSSLNGKTVRINIITLYVQPILKCNYLPVWCCSNAN